MTATRSPRLDVVVPTLDEEQYLPELLSDLTGLRIPYRVIVADGGSRDGTREIAEDRGGRVVRAERGRASQMNAGAAHGRAPWILFLHADSRLSPHALRTLEAWLARPGQHGAAYFRFRLRGAGWFWRFIELGQGLRERAYGLVYGDQGLVVARGAFSEVGGYPDLPLMEDVEMVRRLRRAGAVGRLSAELETSPRRYEREGRVFSWIRNSALIGLYLMGVSPARLVRWYSHRPKLARSARRPLLLVFAKAPRPGSVKTRLAADVGDGPAATIYASMGRQIVDQIRPGPFRVVICYDPPDARPEIEAWLDPRGLEFWPQTSGHLGQRLSSAFDKAFAEADRVCVIGTDSPAVDEGLVIEAFDGLDAADAVLGPARDGGYYLLALKAPLASVFEGIPWSTNRVAEITRGRIADSGRSLIELPILEDVDRVADVPRGLLPAESR